MKDMIKKVKFAREASNEFIDAIEWNESRINERKNHEH
jgi:hypothetical protein